MRLLFFALTITFFGACAFADEIPASCPPTSAKVPSNERDTLLSKIQNAYTGVRTLTAEFAQSSTLAALDTSETSTGSMYFEKPGRMRWHYTNPEEQFFTLRDSALWLYNPADKSVVIEKVAEAFISDLPVAFIMGVGNLARDFDLKTACALDGETLLELTPRKGNGPAKRDDQLRGFTLIVGKEDLLPRGARIVDVSGNVTSLRLSRLAVNRDLPKDVFSTKVPPGTDINDRRKEPLDG
jgi:outer membrane lipoprotein carrier protein